MFFYLYNSQSKQAQASIANFGCVGCYGSDKNIQSLSCSDSMFFQDPLNYTLTKFGKWYFTQINNVEIFQLFGKSRIVHVKVGHLSIFSFCFLKANLNKKQTFNRFIQTKEKQTYLFTILDSRSYPIIFVCLFFFLQNRVILFSSLEKCH